MISLDFELHWGVRQSQSAKGPFRTALMGARAAVPLLLETFQRAGVGATWATVGLLFAHSRTEMQGLLPSTRPRYADPTLSPYEEEVGQGEGDDPIHFAPSLLRRILDTPRQELGSHTFSHYFCLEAQHDVAAFRADLHAASAAAAQWGVELRSLVFPRNQVHPDYLDVVREAGYRCYRGVQRAWMYRSAAREGMVRRGARLADAYLPLTGPNTWRWDALRARDGLSNVPASMFLRPCSPRLPVGEGARFRRIARAIRHAAAAGEVFHLWWHPHNFGRRTSENMAFLNGLLREFEDCRARYGMRSLTMAEAAGEAE